MSSNSVDGNSRQRTSFKVPLSRTSRVMRPSGQLGDHRQPAFRRQFQRGQRRCGDQPGVQPGCAKGRLEMADDLGRRHHHHHVHALGARLRDVADGRRLHIEGHAALQAETDQRKLLFGIAGEGIEIENRGARAEIGQDERGVLALARGMGGRQRFYGGVEGRLVEDVLLKRRHRQHARRERAEIQLRLRPDTRRRDAGFRHFERHARRRVDQDRFQRVE